MPRVVKSGLIQCSLPIQADEADIPEIVEAMIRKHETMIDEAGQKGVQILCLQEILAGIFPSHSLISIKKLRHSC